MENSSEVTGHSKNQFIRIGAYAVLMALFFSIFAAVGLDNPQGILLAVVLAIAIAVMVERGSGKRRMEILKRRPVRVDGSKLIQEDSSGLVIGAVDLDFPYEVTLTFRGNGEGIYRIVQAAQDIELSSRAPDAEHIVRDLLGISEWPPDAYMNPL